MTGRELDGYWKTVVNILRDGIMIVNTRGAIVSVNQAFEHITGYSREELIGRSCEILHCEACNEAIAKGEGHWCALYHLGKTEQRRCRIRRKDGVTIQALKNAAILRDAEGNVLGAVETLADLSEITEKDNQLEAFRKQLHSEDDFHGIVGGSAPMQQVFDMIENAAGKELVSRAIHDIGLRKDHPFVKVNCASLAESLLESELFGHVRGAYTGAYKDRVGRFVMANKGDIFLDEIGDLPISHPDKTAAGDGGEGGRTGRLEQPHRHGCADHLRHQQGPHAAGRARRLPQGFLFQDQCHPHFSSSPARPGQ